MANVDIDKRRRIMQRSIKLGHCVCDPKRPCPCEVFKNDGICMCAGERPDPVDMSTIRLTELVHNAGCASKIAAADLEAVLGRLTAPDDPAIISGIAAGDDAGVYSLNSHTTLVQTVDVFTPCVDDPEKFGRICAANCLSDIYAMGATPRTALSVMCFPIETLDGRVMYHMLKGAMEVFAAAGVALLGGHSIKDEEIKLGFAITGTTSTDALEHTTARPGDMLVLTKKLGVGVLNFARQIGKVDVALLAEVESSMETLNRDAAEAMMLTGASACTDVTGFGLFGHLISLARHSGVTAEIFADRLPAFDGAIDALRNGIVPGAIERNSEYVGGDMQVADGVPQELVDLGFCAETSGGLLMAIPPERHELLIEELASRGVSAVTVGSVVGESDGKILLSLTGDEGAPTQCKAAAQAGSSCCESAAEPAASCCGSAGDEGADDVTKAFGAFMSATSTGGKVDARTKELVNFALSVITKCKPCVITHRKKAVKMGISPEELDEVAWCAAAMGGAPVRMFYQEIDEDDEGSCACC